MSADNAIVVFEHDGYWVVTNAYVSASVDWDADYLLECEDSRYEKKEKALNRASEIWDDAFIVEYGVVII